MSHAVAGCPVAEIREKDKITGTYLVKHKALQVGKTGKSYLNVVLMDKTGEIEARVWDEAEKAGALFEKDDFVRVKARAQAFQNRLQLNIAHIEGVSEDGIDPADFLPATGKDVEKMYGELRELILQMEDVYLRRLLLLFVDDPDLAWRIRRAPAARTMHHAFVGGLLEHTLSAMKLMKAVAAHYRVEGYTEINEDLLITGIFLHDIGKTLELSYRRSFDYTDAGKLMGHLVMGVEMVNERAAKIPGFPEELRLMVNHLILSHHGILEYGSPKRPKLIEALIVHVIDDLDGKINSFATAMRKNADHAGSWTPYHRMYDRFLWKKPYRSQSAASAPAAEEGVDAEKPRGEAGVSGSEH